MEKPMPLFVTSMADINNLVDLLIDKNKSALIIVDGVFWIVPSATCAIMKSKDLVEHCNFGNEHAEYIFSVNGDSIMFIKNKLSCQALRSICCSMGLDCSFFNYENE